MNATRTTLIASLLALVAPAAALADDACIDCHVVLRRRELRAPALHLSTAGRHGDPIRCTTCHGGDAVASVRAHAPGTDFLARPVAPCIDCHLGPEAREAWLQQKEEARTEEVVGDPGLDSDPDPDSDADADADADPDSDPDFDPDPDSDSDSDPDPVVRPPPSPRVSAYLQSAHASAHLGGGVGPICSDCHLPHRSASPSDPASSVHWTAIPATCARCHGDPSMVGPRVDDPVGLWARSVHGAAWAARGEEGPHGPGCADCHDPHGTRSADEAVLACVGCHEEIRAAFDDGPHARAFERRGFLDCAECHGSHEILAADASLITAGREAACRRCHAPGQEVFTRISALGEALEEADEARRLIARADPSIRAAAAPEIAALVGAVHRLDVDEVSARSTTLMAMAPADVPDEPAPAEAPAADSRPLTVAAVAIAIGVAFTFFWRRRRKR